MVRPSASRCTLRRRVISAGFVHVIYVSVIAVIGRLKQEVSFGAIEPKWCMRLLNWCNIGWPGLSGRCFAADRLLISVHVVAFISFSYFTL